MLIKIDFREHDLNTILIQSNVKIETCNLPIGDIVICDDTGKDILMIERKTLNDLASSICDGRYNEQSYRLNQCSLHNHAIFYLIEGDLRKFQPRSFGRPITKEILISSMTSLSYTKGFSIYRTMDVQETALWILQTTHKLSKLKEPFYYNDPDSKLSYVDVKHNIKKNNITPDNIGILMLSQIPLVSTTSAKAVLLKYTSISNLLTTIREDPNDLYNVHTITSDGKERKLSKSCIINIIEFMKDI
jgi:ERCC4-type nuclease